VTGSELSDLARKKAKEKGLNVFSPAELPEAVFDAILLFQVLEHLPEPVSLVRELVEKYKPKYVLLATPCLESSISWSDRPLYFPPHHISNWSIEAYKSLAKLCGLQVKSYRYEPGPDFNQIYNSFQYIKNRVLYKSRDLPSLFHNRRLAMLQYRIARFFGRPWAISGHSILVCLERKNR